jgi:hypothetical protein
MPRRDDMIDDAIDRWELFHKKAYRKLIDMEVTPPVKWGTLGEAKVTYYRSSKWYKNGKAVSYYHEHEPGVMCYHPMGSVKGLKPAKLPFKEWPTTGAVLGKFLGWDIEAHDGKHLEAEPSSKGAKLCSTADGHMLFVIENGKVTGLLAGPSLKVLAEGIDG